MTAALRDVIDHIASDGNWDAEETYQQAVGFTPERWASLARRAGVEPSDYAIAATLAHYRWVANSAEREACDAPGVER